MTETTLNRDGAARLLEGLEAHLEASGEPSTLLALRREAAARFEELGLPTRRNESWKYTDLRALGKTSRVQAPAPARPVREADLERFTYWGVTAARIVFVNGRYDAGLSRLEGLPEGLRVEPLSAIMARGEGEALAAMLGRRLDESERALARLAAARFTDGVLVRVARGVRIEAPVHVLHLSRDCGEPSAAHLRHVIVADEGSRVRVVERYAGLDENIDAFVNAVTEIGTSPRAEVDHVRIQRESPGTRHLGVVGVTQEASSRFAGTTLSVGGLLGRVETVVRQVGPGAETELSGLAVARGEAHLDHQVRMIHDASHGQSRQLYRNVVADSAVAVFNGTIRVPAGILDTEAHQTNANLLLSDSATVNAKPQLEIDADDVRCSHGATVGAIDPEQLFYLRSRGIPEKVARSALTAAFASDVIAAIGIPAIEKRLNEFLAAELSWERLDDDGEETPR